MHYSNKITLQIAQGIVMSRTPLYNQTHKPSLPPNANAGLHFNKFFSEWSLHWSLTDNQDDEPTSKNAWIRKFVDKQQGNKEQLQALHIRRNNLSKMQSGVFTYFKTQGAFITGMGNPHPIENGFTWHHTLGTPYLSGSSVKGIVKAWCEQWWMSDDSENAEQIVTCKRIFGSYKDDNKDSVGTVIFHDAIPANPVQLKAEIMTPHYSDYYQNGTPPPGDWLSPTPIPFLAVEKEQLFHFMITPRTKQYQADTEQCFEWLKDALQFIGAGAKTSSGYGYFEEYTLARQWIDETINAICISNSIPDTEKYSIHFKNTLAIKWNDIDDPIFKKQAFQEIKKIWIENDKWEEVLKGSEKKAKKTYNEYLSNS